MKKSIVLTLSLLFCFLSCNKNSDENNSELKTIADIKNSVIKSNNEFTFSLFQEINNQEEPAENIFISPLSIYYALSMAANGANGKTAEAFKDVLNLQEADHQAFLDAIDELYNDLIPNNDKVVLEIANSLWIRENFTVKDTFIWETEDYFNAEVRTMDFTNPDALGIINGWIEDKTHGKITKMLSNISPDAVLFIINAIYFNGKWKYAFNDSSNKVSNFYINDETTSQVDFMNREAMLDYYENDLFQSVQLPYDDTNYFMTIILPKQDNSANDFVALFDNDRWNEIQSNSVVTDVFLTIPKFKFSYGTKSIKQELIDMGLSVAFSGEADFSRISNESIFISDVFHKAFVEVNEEGTEAAAATIIEIDLVSAGEDQPPVTKYFNANRPFIFAISEKKSGSILFIGKVNFPAQ